MRLMQRVAISGFLSVMLILLLTGAFITRRDMASVVDRNSNDPLNPAWMQGNAVPDQEAQQGRYHHIAPANKHKQPNYYVIKPPNPPLDDITHQRREKVKEVIKKRLEYFIVLFFKSFV